MSASVKDLLASVQGLVESELGLWLPDPAKDATKLFEAMRYSALGGGKRVRPALCVLTCEAVGGNRASALAAGCALEMIHAYSLVHDDLPAMDDDDLRRGRATNHKVYGDATAILVGDGLQALAFETLVRAYGNDAQLATDLVRLLSVAAGAQGMVGGQAMDMAGLDRDEPSLEQVHRAKTGALLRASVLMGARCGGVREGEPRWEALDAYAQALGLAFQVADDVLDCTASTEVLGKTAGKDAEQGKLTYVAILGLDGARAKASALEQKAIESLADFDAAAQPLRDLAQFVVARSA